MILRNISKNTILATDLKECVSFRDKNLGLLDRKNPRSLLFKTRFGIHTFGLGEPIDILILHSLPRHPDPAQPEKDLNSRDSSGRRPQNDDRGEDNEGGFKIIKLKDGLKPNRVFFWNPLFSIVVELPKETLIKSHTKLDDKLEIIY